MKTYIEFTTNIYSAREMAEYQIQVDKALEAEFGGQMPEHAPLPSQARIAINPEEISNFSECYSLDESHYNQDGPHKMDSVSVTLTTGEALTLNCTYDQFVLKLNEWRKEVQGGTKEPKATRKSTKSSM